MGKQMNIKEKTHERLKLLGSFLDTYDDIINRVLDEREELKKKKGMKKC